MKIVKNVVVPSQSLAGKSTLTSLLTANTTAAGNKFAGRRIYMTKAADGTTRVIAGASNILPKGTVNQQSLIKVQTTGVQQIQVQQPGWFNFFSPIYSYIYISFYLIFFLHLIHQVCCCLSKLISAATTTAAAVTPTKPSEVAQRVQIMRSPDGRLTVKGLMPGQQLVQMPDGKIQVLTTTQIQTTTSTSTPKAQTITPTKTIIKTTPNTSTGKLVLQSNQIKAAQVQPQSPSSKGQQILVKQQGTPVLQKIGTPNTVVVSGGQVLQQQVVVSGQQVIGSSSGQQVNVSF